jgi:hypothetical protein
MQTANIVRDGLRFLVFFEDDEVIPALGWEPLEEAHYKIFRSLNPESFSLSWFVRETYDLTLRGE